MAEIDFDEITTKIVTLTLDEYEARAIQVLIDNTVRLGRGPVSNVFSELGELLDEVLPSVDNFYCTMDEEGVDFLGQTLDSIW